MSGICLCFITVIEETKAYLHPQAVSHRRRTCCVPHLVPPPQNHQVQYLFLSFLSSFQSHFYCFPWQPCTPPPFKTAPAHMQICSELQFDLSLFTSHEMTLSKYPLPIRIQVYHWQMKPSLQTCWLHFSRLFNKVQQITHRLRSPKTTNKSFMRAACFSWT